MEVLANGCTELFKKAAGERGQSEAKKCEGFIWMILNKADLVAIKVAFVLKVVPQNGLELIGCFSRNQSYAKVTVDMPLLASESLMVWKLVRILMNMWLVQIDTY